MTKAATKKQTNVPLTAFRGILGLVFAYALVTRALSTGSYWQYFAGLVFLVIGAKLLVRAFKK
jgi:predicted tellurium resistance membrane protein TerC